MTTTPINLHNWQQRGTWQEIYGQKVFTIDEGAGTETLVMLHGYPTCSFDFQKVLPLFTPHFRVIIHDQLGFGLSDKPLDYSYSLIEQAEAVLNALQ